MTTTLGQRCTVYLDATNTQRFKIESSVDAVDEGDLPRKGSAPFTAYIFVHQIVAENDPKSDTFVRVGNVADLTTLPAGREEAVLKDQTRYLATAFTVIYDDIATASQAKLLIQQRVDNLIADWHAYTEQFLAPETQAPPDHLSSIPFPLTNSLEDTRKSEYSTAHAEYLAAKTASATAAAEYAAAVSSASAAGDQAAQAVADSQQCSQLYGQFNVANTAVSSYRGTINAFVPTAQAFEAASATFTVACSAFNNAALTYIGYGTSPSAPQLATFQAARATYDLALTAWEAVRGTYSTSAAATAVSTEAIAGQPVLASLGSSMASACTTKLNKVQTAALAKVAADSAVASAESKKKAADQAESAALVNDSLKYLAVTALCPDFERIVP